MKILRPDQPSYEAELARLDRVFTPADHVRDTVAEILDAIRAEGDAAVLRLTAKFGGPTLADGSAMRVGREEFAAARTGLDAATHAALAASHANVSTFAARSLRADWTMTNAEGAEVGERFRPFKRVGLYVPGGSAPLVSTALMTATLAQIAGCPEIVVTTPAGPDGSIAPALLAALELAGATEVYRIGGAQAIGALGFGTSTIRPVQKIFGPGNSYVVEAKRQLFGRVAIDLLPGPSEVMVLADAAANPAWIAADLLAQAEHGADSAMIFVTDSPAKLAEVEKEIHLQAASLPRQAQLAGVLENHAMLVLARSLAHAIELVNGYAPEHLSLNVVDSDLISERITTTGCICLGGWSPVAAGDFLAGPSHTLPTGGAGKSFAGLTVDQFQRRTSLIRYDSDSIRRATPVIEQFSALEGLAAHGRSASIRV